MKKTINFNGPFRSISSRAVLSLVLSVMLILISAALMGCESFMNNEAEDQAQPGEENSATDNKLKYDSEPQISVYMHETGEIKELGLEDYLAGVVAAEMDPAWADEALAAQAILARTFTLERMESTGGVPDRGTDASTDIQEFQAYDEQRITDQVLKAVERTRGEVALFEDKLIKAWFFADGGGQTAASALEGLAYDKEPAPYIQSVEDPGSAVTTPENKSWEATFDLKTAQTKLKDFTGTDPGAINEVTILEKGPSGRVTSVKIGSLTTGGPSLRLALGSTEMKSTLLTKLAIQDGQLVAAGKGYGHGVGMSQWGAKALADQGKTGEEIIQYFFKDVTIEKLY